MVEEVPVVPIALPEHGPNSSTIWCMSDLGACTWLPESPHCSIRPKNGMPRLLARGQRPTLGPKCSSPAASAPRRGGGPERHPLARRVLVRAIAVDVFLREAVALYRGAHQLEGRASPRCATCDLWQRITARGRSTWGQLGLQLRIRARPRQERRVERPVQERRSVPGRVSGLRALASPEVRLESGGCGLSALRPAS